MIVVIKRVWEHLQRIKSLEMLLFNIKKTGSKNMKTYKKVYALGFNN